MRRAVEKLVCCQYCTVAGLSHICSAKRILEKLKGVDLRLQLGEMIKVVDCDCEVEQRVGLQRSSGCCG